MYWRILHISEVSVLKCQFILKWKRKEDVKPVYGCPRWLGGGRGGGLRGVSLLSGKVNGQGHTYSINIAEHDSTC